MSHCSYRMEYKWLPEQQQLFSAGNSKIVVGKGKAQRDDSNVQVLWLTRSIYFNSWLKTKEIEILTEEV